MKKVLLTSALLFLLGFTCFCQTWSTTYSSNHSTRQLFGGLHENSRNGTQVSENIFLELDATPDIAATEIFVWSEGPNGDITYLDEHSYSYGTIWINENINYDESQISVLHYSWVVYYTDNSYEEIDGTATY